jgi:protein-S-isoprenylcysteine O-methyltransferase Ste14
MRTDNDKTRIVNLNKAIIHNLGVTIVCFVFTFIGVGLDSLLGIDRFYFPLIVVLGGLLLLAGFLLRVWAAYHFYQRSMKVVVLSAQQSLITDGPYQFSRNPLYLGGNIVMFYGTALLFGTVSGLILFTLHIPLIDWMVRREEKQLEKKFGEEWLRYKKRVRRWF